MTKRRIRVRRLNNFLVVARAPKSFVCRAETGHKETRIVFSTDLCHLRRWTVRDGDDDADDGRDRRSPTRTRRRLMMCLIHRDGHRLSLTASSGTPAAATVADAIGS